METPSIQDLKTIITMNLLKDIEITLKDIDILNEEKNFHICNKMLADNQ